MIRDENYKNDPLPPDLLFRQCIRENKKLPSIEFCSDCGTWHSNTDDCVMIQNEMTNELKQLRLL